MADNQLARSGTTDIDLFSDDDPLSELARIVGYDNRPAVQQLQELERHRNAVRQEPVLDLEDELLREFESYAPGAESPAAAPVAERPVAEQGRFVTGSLMLYYADIAGSEGLIQWCLLIHLCAAGLMASRESIQISPTFGPRLTARWVATGVSPICRLPCIG